jgi:tetratricopeptide (TPR) repeat protein
LEHAWALDTAGRAGRVIRLAAGLGLLYALSAGAQSPADLDYQRGMHFASLGRWEDARRAFQAGERKQPRQARFPLELAGVAFKQNQFARAKVYLHRALALHPADPYANDFLGTIYSLEENLEAALTFWNRAGRPRIQNVRFQPPPAMNAVLLDRALAFAPAGILRLSELQASRARLEALEVFPRLRFELEARAEDNFDVVIHAVERSAWSKSALISMLSGLPYQTVYPEFYNLRRSSRNLISLVRWDAQKRRAFVSWAGPIGKSATWRYRFYADGRNENWQLTGIAPGRFNLRKAELGGEVSSLEGGRWSWSSGAAISRRDFRNALVSGLPPDVLLSNGALLKYRGSMRAWLLRVPERRVTLASGAVAQYGRIFAHGASSFTRTEGSLDAQWFPQARGDDYPMKVRLRAGKTWGDIPFDELIQLGLERDNNLPLRAHIGTLDGRKGHAPLGRDYFLLNWEQDKVVYRSPVFSVKLGPFLDSGHIFHSIAGLASGKWMFDAGLQCKLVVFGTAVELSFGKDLRSGRNAFYVGRP